MNSICVLFDHLGPYHRARLNAVGALLPTIGVELFDANPEFGWDTIDSPTAFRRFTLFPKIGGPPKRTQELVRRVRQALDEIQPATVAIPGWSSKAALAALSWCLKTATPAILMSDSQACDATRTWPREAVKKHVVAMCSTGLVAGKRHLEYLAALGMPRERIFTGYDVVDNDHFEIHSDAARLQAARLRAQMDLPEKYFLASARFIPKKNLLRLLAAFYGYRQHAGPSAWKLVLLGDGPLRPQLRAEIKQLGLEADVFLPGLKRYDELPAYYGLAGAFLHASTIDQWGLVVNEAMACGLPVLVSNRCGCAPDLVADGRNGFMFDPWRKPDLVALLRRMTSNECDLATLGHASREIIRNWSPQRFAVNLQIASETALQMPRRKSSTLNRIILRSLLQGQTS